MSARLPKELCTALLEAYDQQLSSLRTQSMTLLVEGIVDSFVAYFMGTIERAFLRTTEPSEKYLFEDDGVAL